jgi:hypothetical protein
VTSYLPCRIAQVPRDKFLTAARTALETNPANRPTVVTPPPTPEHLALLVSKYWGAAKGVNLTVSFLDGPDAETRRKILLAANSWSKTANVNFTETASGGQVRISRTPGQGYYSYLGTDVLGIPAGEPTMNLDSFTARTPDSEYNRVVKHEFGHVLGFPHEHTRKEIVGRIDPAKADAYFLQYDGWDAQTVQEQVLAPLADALLTSLPTDVLSIMCYALDGSIMKDGVAVPGGTDIDPEDYKLAATLYPKGDVVVPPVPPQPPTPAPGKLFTLTFRQPVRAGGQVSFRARVAIPPGAYDVIPEGVAGHAEVEAEVG